MFLNFYNCHFILTIEHLAQEKQRLTPRLCRDEVNDPTIVAPHFGKSLFDILGVNFHSLSKLGLAFGNFLNLKYCAGLT